MVMTLYDETETPKVDFVGFITDNERFDFGIIHTNQSSGSLWLYACRPATRHCWISRI